MISTNDLRRGMSIEVDNQPFYVIEQQHIKPGKGGAFVRVKLKNIKSGVIIDKTLNAGVKVKLIEIEERKMQYMYRDNASFYFMDLNTYEQFPISGDVIKDYVKFLKDGIVITILMYNEDVVDFVFPTTVELKVLETSPAGVKGNTVSGSGKPAKLESGSVIQVPYFIDVDDTVRVDTRTGKYVERVNK